MPLQYFINNKYFSACKTGGLGLLLCAFWVQCNLLTSRNGVGLGIASVALPAKLFTSCDVCCRLGYTCLRPTPPSQRPNPTSFDVAVPCESHFVHVCVSVRSLTLTVNVCKWQRYDRSRQSGGHTHVHKEERHSSCTLNEIEVIQWILNIMSIYCNFKNLYTISMKCK